MIALIAAALVSVIPVHGVVLDSRPDGTAIVRTDAVPRMQPSLIRSYRFAPTATFVGGTAIDALLDPSTEPPTLRDAAAAGPFAPGLPDRGRVVPVSVGAPLPDAELVDDRGTVVHLGSAFKGRTLLLSFVFTRCPDRTVCPAISSKFAYLQAHLEAGRFALAEITLDPPYDSPAVLRAYGTAFGALPDRWKLLTGTGSTIAHVLDEFGISSMRVSTSAFLHDDRLFVVAPDGRIADVVRSEDWDPGSVAAEARSVSGLAANPFERFKLALVADVIALCGGTQSGGVVLLELSLFALFTIAAVGGMWLVARVLWARRTF